MISVSGPAPTIIIDDFWWEESLPRARSAGSSKLVAKKFPLPKFERKQAIQASTSFWNLLPLDLGSVRSDRLDDFLYGA